MKFLTAISPLLIILLSWSTLAASRTLGTINENGQTVTITVDTASKKLSVGGVEYDLDLLDANIIPEMPISGHRETSATEGDAIVIYLKGEPNYFVCQPNQGLVIRIHQSAQPSAPRFSCLDVDSAFH